MRALRPMLAFFLALLAAPGAWAASPAAAIQALLGLHEPPPSTPYIHVERRGNAVRGVIAQVIDLPADHVLYEVLLCYGAFTEWFPLQKDARYVTPVHDQRARIYGALEFPWPIGVRDFEAEIHGWRDTSYQPEVYRIDFAHVRGTGNIGAMEGSWLIQAYGPDRALVVYDSTADFDTWVPGFLMARGTRQFLPAIMERMARRTARCPAAARPAGSLPPRP